MLSSDEIKRLQSLISGTRAPETGMEQHFMRVMRGEARPCTEKEEEWNEIWRSAQFGAHMIKRSFSDTANSQGASSSPDHSRHTEPALTTPLSLRLCSDCGISIPPERINAVPDITRCIKCQNDFEMHHDTRPRINEGLAGTRDAHKKMRGKLWGDMRNRGRGK